MVKWISQSTSDRLSRVRVLLEAPQIPLVEPNFRRHHRIYAIYLGLSSDFIVARFFLGTQGSAKQVLIYKTKNSNSQINKLSTYGFDFLK